MDAAAAALLIRATTEAGIVLATLLRAQGKEDEAGQVETITRRSDPVWQRVLDKSKQL